MALRKFRDKWRVRRQINDLFDSKADALKFEWLLESAIADVRRKHRENVTPCCTIKDKLEEFLSDSAAGLRPRRCGYLTVAGHRRRLQAFDRAFQHKPLDAVSRLRLENWIKRRLKHVSPRTVNIDLSSLHAFARWAQAKEYAPAFLPLLTVRPVHVPGNLAGTNRKPPKAREMGEMERIIATTGSIRQDIALFMLGMALYGLRPDNVCRLRRRDARLPVGGERGRLHVVGLKGTPDRDLAVPPGSLRERWLRECLAMGITTGRTTPLAPLLPALKGRSARNPGGWTSATFNMALTRLLHQRKIRMTPYVVRHTCMTYLLRHPEVAQANSQHYAGHQRVETQNAYNGLVGNDAEPAYSALEKRLDKPALWPS